MATRLTEPQRRVLRDLSEHDYLLDDYWDCYYGAHAVIASVIRRGWAERLPGQPKEGLRITEAGRTTLENVDGEVV